MTRKEILDAAEKCVCGDRDTQYGSPDDSFSVIAHLWSVYLERELDTKDVAALMALFKVARIKTGANKADNWIDLAGYAACGGECERFEGIGSERCVVCGAEIPEGRQVCMACELNAADRDRV